MPLTHREPATRRVFLCPEFLMQLVRGYTPLGTFGRWLTDASEFVCHSLERPWRDNLPFQSCIPEGDYRMAWHDSPRFGRTVILEGGTVSRYADMDHKRWGILIHPANWADQLQGCIAPGQDLGVLFNRWAVLSSRAATADLLTLLGAEIAQGRDILTITHATAY